MGNNWASFEHLKPFKWPKKTTWIWLKLLPRPFRLWPSSWITASSVTKSKKKAQEAKAKQVRIQIKEVKFRPGTDDGDYNVKLRSLIRFLEDGDKCKVTLRFRGREMAHQELGARLLDRVKDDLAELGVVEQMPKLEGRQMVMMIAPKRK